MAAAAEAAGAEWDAWHEASVAKVGAIVEVETDDPWAEKAPVPEPSPLAGEGGAPAGAEGEGSAAPAAASPDDTAPAEPPYEIKSYPPEPPLSPRNPVTSVNPPAPPAADGGKSRDTATPHGAGNLRPSKALCAA